MNSTKYDNDKDGLKIDVNNEINEQDYVIIVGYGPVGQAVTKILNDKGISVNIIELNIDTVKKIKDKRRRDKNWNFSERYFRFSHLCNSKIGYKI